MKTIKQQIRSITLLITSVILFQGCLSNKSNTTTLEAAEQSENKVKITTTSNKTYNFLSIEFQDGLYYGLKKAKGKIIQTPLNENTIKEIRIKDNVKSMFLIFSLLLFIIAGFMYRIRKELNEIEYDFDLVF